MLFYIALSSRPNICTFCNMVDREIFSVFRVDHCVQTSGHLCLEFIHWVHKIEGAIQEVSQQKVLYFQP